jgi:hypothetical protein
VVLLLVHNRYLIMENNYKNKHKLIHNLIDVLVIIYVEEMQHGQITLIKIIVLKKIIKNLLINHKIKILFPHIEKVNQLIINKVN